MPISCTFILNRKENSAFSCDGTPPVVAFSGQKDGRDNPDDTAIEDIGPLPKGRYYLVDRQSGGILGGFRDWVSAHGHVSTDRSKWFMLWNPVTGDKTNIEGITRGSFRLHPMGPHRLSMGCITVRHQYEFDRLEKFIRSQKPSIPVPGTSLKAYGTVDVK